MKIDITQELLDRVEDNVNDLLTVRTELTMEEFVGYATQLAMRSNSGDGDAIIQLGVISLIETIRRSHV